MINLDNINIEHRKYFVLYFSSNFIIYRDGKKIILANCSGDIVSSTDCPSMSIHYDVAELDDAFLFIFSNRHIVIIDKNGFESILYDLDVSRIGKPITKLNVSGTNSILFGTLLNNSIQFINFDFMGQKRISQTSSWKVKNVTDYIVHDKYATAILDNSFVVNFDIHICETRWQRFEGGFIEGNISIYKNDILYVVQNVVRIVKSGNSIENIIIPRDINKIENIINNNVYFTFNEKKYLGCFNIERQDMLWEMAGQSVIHETVCTKGKDVNGVYDIMILRLDDSLSLVNLTLGKSLYYLTSRNLFKIRKTSDNVLLQKYHGDTDLLGGYL